MYPPIDGLEERTWYCDRLYGVIGRALAYAQGFEGECKALVAMLKVRGKLRTFNRGATDTLEEQIGTIVQKIQELPLGPHIKDLKRAIKEGAAESFDEASATQISDYFYPILDNAKNARNEIAHDLARGISNSMADQDVEFFIERVKTLIQQIVEAYLLVFNTTQWLTQEDTMGERGRYCEAVIDWVCNIEDS
jgi:hypothetical protein